MRSIWGTLVILALLVGSVTRARAERPALILSPVEQQALVDARMLTGTGAALSVLGGIAGVSSAALGLTTILADRPPDAKYPAAIGLAVAGPVLVESESVSRLPAID
jgi:hypothetical protein